MKRYLLFEGYQYYPCGGWGDFAGAFDTAEEALDHRSTDNYYDWFQVIDLVTGEEVKQ